ncbi:MAG: M28 family peptidase, partial [Candidatus Aegiribacteria sp.]|nr:M28 family peptidase [Candidatus Aegiribacteria sp.]
VSTVEELEKVRCAGKILLMKGAICSEQLMPKKFEFYNPEHHRRIISLLESSRSSGIVTATARNPEQAGALYPHPLFVDGDFHIPSVYCKDSTGEELACFTGREFQLKIDAKRIPSIATNVIARLNQEAQKKILITAHIDAYEDSPGALDNASGTSVLLLLAEMLSDYRGSRCIEIAAFNGEDHYSAGGQKDYLNRYGCEISSIQLTVNIDGIGYNEGKVSFSFYGCSSELQSRTEAVFNQFDSLIHGEKWFSGDHMIFVQKRIPSIAFTSECMSELMRTVVHTSSDTPDMVDPHSLVETAQALNSLVRSLQTME